MQIPDALLTIAQLALGLAGFSGVILAFGGSPERMHPIDWARMHVLLFVALGTMVLCVIPFALEVVGLEASALWRLGCSAVVGYFVLLGVSFVQNVRRMDRSPRAALMAGGLGGRPWAVVVAASGVVAFLAPALHALGFFPTRGPAIFLLEMLWLLIMASYLFASLVFVRPPEVRP